TSDGRTDPCQVFARRALQLREKALETEEAVRLLVRGGSLSRVEEGRGQRLELVSLEAETEQKLVRRPGYLARRETAHPCEDGARQDHGGTAEHVLEERRFKTRPVRSIGGHDLRLRRQRAVARHDVVRAGQAVGAGPP